MSLQTGTSSKHQLKPTVFLLRYRNEVFAAVVLITIIFQVVIIKGGSSSNNNPASDKIVCPGSIKSIDSSITGVSGTLFSGKPYRTWNGSRGKTLRVQKGSKKINDADKLPCKYWSVVTTIFEPTEGINKQANLGPEWCIVIVGDKKSPPKYEIKGSSEVVYLDVEKQLEYSKKFPNLINSLPWNHFGRKNVGFLFAIEQGAEAIWDFDDDNAVKPNLNPVFPKDGENIDVNVPQGHTLRSYNPYPSLGASEKIVWPRGLPLHDVLNELSYNATLKTVSMPGADIGVVQSAADHDPDVDGIYRLTHKLPFYFGKPSETKPILIPERSLTPFNAQACLFKKSAFFMLFLPISVHGRVSDIWRGYFGQRLLWDAGIKFLYSTSYVDQYRNAHNYLGDVNAEIPLYERSGVLVDFLREWKSDMPRVSNRMEELYIALYERGYIEEKDVSMIQNWLVTLEEIGYEFPVIK